MRMHIFLRGRATDFIRFSKGFKTSHANSIRNRQPSHSAGSAPVNIFPRHIPLYWRETTGTFILDLIPILLTGHQATLVSRITETSLSPTGYFVLRDLQTTSRGRQEVDSRGLSAEWVCLRLGTSSIQSVLTPPLASIIIEFKPGYGP